MISLIAAASRNNVIGNKGTLPWHMPADLQRFRDLTRGHTVIMGRKTYESIITMRGAPLPKRLNIVVTRDTAYHVAPGVKVAHTLQDALHTAGDDAFVIGGGQLYAEALPVANRIYLTEVDATVQGDAFFPKIPTDQWRVTAREPHQKDADNQYDYSYVTLERI